MEVQTAVQQLLLEHGAYAPIELLLATNRLSCKLRFRDSLTEGACGRGWGLRCRRSLGLLRTALRGSMPVAPDEDCAMIHISASGHRARPSMPSSAPANPLARTSTNAPIHTPARTAP